MAFLRNELQKALFSHANTKGEYESRRKALESLYSAEDIDSELTADLVGDYLFTDKDFVNNLSVTNRNVFQKIYDEIKYLCKIATARRHGNEISTPNAIKPNQIRIRLPQPMLPTALENSRLASAAAM